MKISENTMAILKNYAGINESIIFRPGSNINTVANAKNLLSVATVEEKFPKLAAIYNLNQLLNTLSLFENPDVDFKDTHMVISDDNGKVKYFYAALEVIDINDSIPKLPESILEFALEKEDLQSLAKAASVMNLEDLVLTAENGKLILSVVDSKDPTSNTFSREVGDSTFEGEFNFNFKSDSLKLIPGDYNVTIAGKGGKFISRFSNTSSDIIYFIALDPASSVS